MMKVMVQPVKADEESGGSPISNRHINGVCHSIQIENVLRQQAEDSGTILVLEDINAIEILALPGVPALINPGRAELIAVRPISGSSLRILLALAEHGRFRAIAATATIIESEVCHA